MSPRRFVSQFCLALLLLLLALTVAPVRAAQEGGFIFDRNGATAVLTGYVGLGGALVIPDRLGNLPVASIGDWAFYHHTDLTSVTIPSGVTSIGNRAFYGCTGLRAIEVDSLNLAYSSAAGVLFNKAQSVLIAYPAGQAGPYTIPSSVASIGRSAFSSCTGLTSVTIPNSVASIGDQAFAGCTGLTSVTIPNSVTSIGYEVFSGCTGLTSVYFEGNSPAADGIG